MKMSKNVAAWTLTQKQIKQSHFYASQRESTDLQRFIYEHQIIKNNIYPYIIHHDCPTKYTFPRPLILCQNTVLLQKIQTIYENYTSKRYWYFKVFVFSLTLFKLVTGSEIYALDETNNPEAPTLSSQIEEPLKTDDKEAAAFVEDVEEEPNIFAPVIVDELQVTDPLEVGIIYGIISLAEIGNIKIINIFMVFECY